MRLVFLVFLKEASELPTVLFFVSEEFDAEVLRNVIDPITQTNNLVVLFNRSVFRFDDTMNCCNDIC